jgi:hypothetical protein
MALEQKWHGMRKRDIWTLEVHDVLEANQTSIRLFMEWYIKTKSRKQGRKAMNLDDIHEMMQSVPKGGGIKTIKEELQLSEM